MFHIQDFLFSNLGELMNQHVFCDKKSIAGHVVVELGRAETYLIRCSRAQAGERMRQIHLFISEIMFAFASLLYNNL
jgi:hypothetical protein